MREAFWRVVARVLSRPAVRDWLVLRALDRPYSDIVSRDGQEVYMKRWWLFNPYRRTEAGEAKRNWLMQRLPSVRVHLIRKGDSEPHMHDHPWNARSIILTGGYAEEVHAHPKLVPWMRKPTRLRMRVAGDTTLLRFGEYHRIDEVSEGGALTLFITWGYRGTWGFLVGGEKIPYHTYLDALEKNPEAWADDRARP